MLSEKEFYQEVYDSLLCGYYEEYRLSWVPDFCDPDSP